MAAEELHIQVSQIKEKVEEKEGIPPVQQRLIHGGKQMYGHYTTWFSPLPRPEEGGKAKNDTTAY